VAKSVMIKSLMTGALGRRSSRGKAQTTESQPRSEATYPKGVIKGSGGRGNVCSFAREGVVSCMTQASVYETLHCRSCCILAVECPVEKSQFVRVDAVREAGKTDAYAVFGCIEKFRREGVSEGEKSSVVLGEERVDVKEIL